MSRSSGTGARLSPSSSGRSERRRAGGARGEAAVARPGGDGVRERLRLAHAPDRIGMEEHAALEVRSRRGSSIYVGTELVNAGEADAFVSAGNTGAVLATALVVLGRLPGVERPALGVVLPATSGPRLLVDAGANAESRASHLVQFAHLGDAYARVALGVASPRVALLSIGGEASKGSSAVVEAHAALARARLRFVGNVEGHDLIATSAADVIVADGFSGNVALKSIEGVIAMLWEELSHVARSSARGRLGGWLLTPGLRATRGRLDYRRYGGAPLLGARGGRGARGGAGGGGGPPRLPPLRGGAAARRGGARLRGARSLRCAGDRERPPHGVGGRERRPAGHDRGFGLPGRRDVGDAAGGRGR